MSSKKSQQWKQRQLTEWRAEASSQPCQQFHYLPSLFSHWTQEPSTHVLVCVVRLGAKYPPQSDFYKCFSFKYSGFWLTLLSLRSYYNQVLPMLYEPQRLKSSRFPVNATESERWPSLCRRCHVLDDDVNWLCLPGDRLNFRCKIATFTSFTWWSMCL